MSLMETGGTGGIGGFAPLQEEAVSVGGHYDRDEAIEGCKSNPNFLAGLCAPDIFKFLWPPIFLAIWSLFLDALAKPSGLIQIAIGLPRGFAKTFFLKIFTIYCIIFTNRKFILVVCNTEQLAMNFIADVCDILDSINIKSLFGDWKLGAEKDTQGIKKFGFRGRDIILAGVGVGTSLRGLNIKFRRPDVIIMDDMQKREDAENDLIATKQLTWLLGTLLKARNYSSCLAIFVGNLYPFKGSILSKLKRNPKWVSFICGGILEDGKSLWEELRPIEDLLAELENDIAMGHPEIFYSEVLNDEEAGTVAGLDTAKIPPFPPSLEHIEPQGGFIIIDPASGKITGNDVAVGLFHLYDAMPVLSKVVSKKMSPFETIQLALLWAVQNGIQVIAVESHAYQYTLLFWFQFVCTQLKIEGIHFVELENNAYAKNAKIKDMIQQLVKGEILLRPEVRAEVVTQIIHWNPLKRDNVDDILDLLAWCYRAIDKYGVLMSLNTFVERLALDLSPQAMTEVEIAEALPF